MHWSSIGGRKHSGKTLPQILFQDPDYFFWAVEVGYLEMQGERVWDEACDLYLKAKNIRIPQEGPEKRVVEYTLNDFNNKLAHVEIVPISRPHHRRSFREPVLDLSVGRRLCKYDKHAGELLVIAVKELLLGGRSTPMTQARCEAFFDNDRNFALDGVLVSGGHFGLEG